jgi:hypothetical protein
MMTKSKEPAISSSTEQQIETFAEDLGKLLGHAQNKAEGWLGQRKQIVTHLETIRETATNLLNQLGHISSNAAGTTKRAYRRTAKTQPEEVVAKVKAAARTMSDEAKARIAAAQKKRWAKWRKEKK